MGLIIETSGGGGEHKVKNPKAFVLVAFDTLIITENGDVRGERIPIHVDETGAQENDCSVNVDVWDVDVYGKSGCDGIGDCSEER